MYGWVEPRRAHDNNTNNRVKYKNVAKGARTCLANHPVYVILLYELRRPFAHDVRDTHADYTAVAARKAYIREYNNIRI
jgi:hypothetical protein